MTKVCKVHMTHRRQIIENFEVGNQNHQIKFAVRISDAMQLNLRTSARNEFVSRPKGFYLKNTNGFAMTNVIGTQLFSFGFCTAENLKNVYDNVES